MFFWLPERRNICQMWGGWFKSDLMTGSSHSINRTMCGGGAGGGLGCYYLLLLPSHLLLSCLAPHQIVLYGAPALTTSQYCQQATMDEDTGGTRLVYSLSWSHHHLNMLTFYWIFTSFFPNISPFSFIRILADNTMEDVIGVTGRGLRCIIIILIFPQFPRTDLCSQINKLSVGFLWCPT